MRIDDNQRLGPRRMPGFKTQPVFGPATFFSAVAINRHPAADRIQQ
jgi:hypothetical protein